MMKAIRAFLKQRLSSDQKIWLTGLLKEVTTGELRRRMLVSHYWHRSRHIKFGPEDISKHRVAVVVDLGANVGEFAQVAASFADEVHAFEPEPSVFEALSKNTEHLDNVHVHQAAVAVEDGECRLFRSPKFWEDDESSSLGSSMFAEHSGLEGGDFVVTPQIGIETLLDQIGRPVDIMKMDIEGAEVPVLERLFSSPMVGKVRELYVETHEHVLPDLAERTEALRKRARNIESLKSSFDWR